MKDHRIVNMNQPIGSTCDGTAFYKKRDMKEEIEKKWEIDIMELIKTLELKAYRIANTENKDNESLSPNKRGIVKFIQNLLDKQKADIQKLIRDTLSIDTLKEKKELDELYNKMDKL